MKLILPTTLSAFAFATLGLLAAFGIAMFAPSPNQNPDFARTMFIILPLGGTVIGWVIAYVAAPFSEQDRIRHPSSSAP